MKFFPSKYSCAAAAIVGIFLCAGCALLSPQTVQTEPYTHALPDEQPVLPAGEMRPQFAAAVDRQVNLFGELPHD